MKAAGQILGFPLAAALCAAGACEQAQFEQDVRSVGVSAQALTPHDQVRVTPGPTNLATVNIRISASVAEIACSGTLIGPTTVLTAAHCTGVSEEMYSVSLDTPFVASSLVNDCAAHPNATAVTGRSCDELPFHPSPLTINERFDLAVLELDDDLVAEAASQGLAFDPRPIFPPRACLNDGGARLWQQGWGTNRDLGEIRVSGGLSNGVLHVTSEPGFGFEDGDSGGPTFDPDYVVLAAFSKFTPGGNTADNAFLWSEPLANTTHTMDWLMDVLDPGRTCRLGSPAGGCQMLGRNQPDRDDDGLPDLVDLCPDNPPNRVCAGNHCDEDGDFVGNECDACSSGEAIPNVTSCDHADDDGDGIPNGCDSCPSGRTRNDGDDDGDGIDDSCDLCPTMPAAPSGACFPSHCDADNDGIGDECDNCAAASNPAQRNCNQDAERALGIFDPASGRFGVGDACDSARCGDTRVRDGMVPTGILGATRPAIIVDVDALTAPAVSGARNTGFRFCRCSAAGDDTLGVRESCERTQLDGTGQCEVATQAALALYDQRVDTQRWRLLTMASSSAGAEFGLPYAVPQSFFASDLSREWTLLQDTGRWRTAFGETDLPTGPPTLAPRYVPGVLWTHTRETTVERRKFSHYWSGRAALPPVLPPIPDCIFAGEAMPLLVRPGECPVCAGMFPEPQLLATGTRTFLGSCNTTGTTPLLVVSRGYRFDPALIYTAAGLARIRQVVLDPAMRWVTAAEALSGFRSGQIRAISIARDGASFGPVQQFGSEGISVRDLSALPAGPMPLPREGHSVVLSAERQQVWLVGGAEPQTGRQLHELWSFDLGALTWRRLPLPIERSPERVLAATFSSVDDALWVLDMAGPSWLKRVRLLRVAAFGQTVEEVLSWPRFSLNTRYQLAVDPQGDVFVAASGEVGFHQIVRFARQSNGRFVPDGGAIGDGVLVEGSMRASDVGVSLAVQQFTLTQVETLGYETKSLSRSNLDSVLRQCF